MHDEDSTTSGGQGASESTGEPGDSSGTADGGDDGAAPVCGNGILEPGEVCDDGDTDDSNACTSTCDCNPDVPESPCFDPGGAFEACRVGGVQDFAALYESPPSLDFWDIAGSGAAPQTLGPGDEVFFGTPQRDAIYGEDGRDTIFGNENHDLIVCGPDDDLAYGGMENDRMYGNEGHDELHGDRGDDLIRGNAGNDLLYGDLDELQNDAFGGDDVIYGDDEFGMTAGDDRILGLGGNDWIFGGPGQDELFGNRGNDWIFGNAGDDFLYGGQEDDVLQGGRGADLLSGDLDDDILRGDRGDDVLRGGPGDDIYHVTGANEDGDDVIDDDPSGFDALYFKGVSLSDLTYTIENNDLIVSAPGTSIRIRDHFLGANRIECLYTEL